MHFFTWITPSGPYSATTCRERELTLDHIILFWLHKGMEGLPGWGISSMSGPPPRQHKHERLYTPFTQPFILTRRIWKEDYDGQMIFRGPRGPNASRHLSYRCGKTQKKTSPRKFVRIEDRTRTRCVTGAHTTTCSTVVDSSDYISANFLRNY